MALKEMGSVKMLKIMEYQKNVPQKPKHAGTDMDVSFSNQVQKALCSRNSL